MRISRKKKNAQKGVSDARCKPHNVQLCFLCGIDVLKDQVSDARVEDSSVSEQNKVLMGQYEKEFCEHPKPWSEPHESYCYMNRYNSEWRYELEKWRETFKRKDEPLTLTNSNGITGTYGSTRYYKIYNQSLNSNPANDCSMTYTEGYKMAKSIITKKDKTPQEEVMKDPLVSPIVGGYYLADVVDHYTLKIYHDVIVKYNGVNGGINLPEYQAIAGGLPAGPTGSVNLKKYYTDWLG
jgi:hypothetical protein